MSLHEIKKQKLLHEPFSDDALKLARAIYNTHKKDDEELFLEIKVPTIIKLLNLHPSKEAIKYIRDLLEELNEPLCVRGFKFFAKVYPMRFITFCTYEINEETLELNLSEEFLHVENEYMLDPFLSV